MTAPNRAAWYADDRFWSAFFEHLFPESRITEAAEIVRRSPLFHFPVGTRILDLCCGPGVFTVPLAKAGYKVTGVDRAKELLARASWACRHADVDARLVEADMRDFVEPGAFDVIANMFTSFGYFDCEEDNARVLRNAYASLASGGTLIIDLIGKEVLARIDERTVLSEQDGKLLVQRGTILDDWTRLRSDWFSIDGGTVNRASVTISLYSAKELRCMLTAAGFTDVRCYGSYQGAAYDQQAERLIAVAIKGGSGRAD